MRTRQRIISIAAACVTLIAMTTTASAADHGESLPPTRIIGGNEATPGEYPFVVAIVERHEPSAWHGARCGGTVVTSNWVLTAASCVDGEQPSHLDIVAGRHDLTTDEGIRVPVAEIVVHPLFRRGSPDHDAALLRVAEPLGVEPIRLPSTTGQPPAGTGAVVTGWGDTNTEARYPRRLHHVEVSVVDDDVCLETYGAEYDTRFMLCAGDLEQGGVDACDGDEGGPLLIGTEGSWTQVGIDSWGLGCGLPDYPGRLHRDRVDARLDPEHHEPPDAHLRRPEGHHRRYRSVRHHHRHRGRRRDRRPGSQGRHRRNGRQRPHLCRSWKRSRRRRRRCRHDLRRRRQRHHPRRRRRRSPLRRIRKRPHPRRGRSQLHRRRSRVRRHPRGGDGRPHPRRYRQRHDRR